MGISSFLRGGADGYHPHGLVPDKRNILKGNDTDRTPTVTNNVVDIDTDPTRGVAQYPVSSLEGRQILHDNKKQDKTLRKFNQKEAKAKEVKTDYKGNIKYPKSQKPVKKRRVIEFK